jgi:hypothetical protein
MVDVTKRTISLNASNLLEDKSIETFIPVTTNETLFLRCFTIRHPSHLRIDMRDIYLLLSTLHIAFTGSDRGYICQK